MQSPSSLCFICFTFQDGVKKTYRRSLIKHYAKAFMELTFENNYHEKLDDLEKKAVYRYFVFLLSKKDYFSDQLIAKAKTAGFNEANILPLIETFQSQGLLNDKKLNHKKQLLKIKKGYSIKHTSLCDDPEAQILDMASLKKLIEKKKNLLLSDDLKQKAKGYRFFISRGYDINQIKEQLQD